MVEIENSAEQKTFICYVCSSEKALKELANTFPVYGEEPRKTCRECYDSFQNPSKQKEKKVERQFFCSFCRSEVFSVRYKIRVSVSMPNELGLVNGEVYNFCSACKSKVKEYVNEEEENKEPEIWE